MATVIVKKRIPPKGTLGFKQYWKDRYNMEDLERTAKMWATAATHDPRVGHVATRVAEAAFAMRTIWENTDYFEYNQCAGSST